MPLLRLDLFERGEAPVGRVGMAWMPASEDRLSALKQRWCGQCRNDIYNDCPIISKYEAVVAMAGGSPLDMYVRHIVSMKHPMDVRHAMDVKQTMDGGRAMDVLKLAPKEWVVQPDGQPRCVKMDPM